MRLRPGWIILRAGLVAAWVLLLLVTIHASRTGGANGWIAAFAQGLREPWPAQFDTDFTIHLCLMAVWLCVRERTLAWGVLWAVLALVGGSLFSLPYLFVLSFRVEGDWRRFLLGQYA